MTDLKKVAFSYQEALDAAQATVAALDERRAIAGENEAMYWRRFFNEDRVEELETHIKELETALRYIERKGHLSGSMAARVARAALRDFTLSGTRSALDSDPAPNG